MDYEACDVRRMEPWFAGFIHYFVQLASAIW